MSVYLGSIEDVFKVARKLRIGKRDLKPYISGFVGPTNREPAQEANKGKVTDQLRFLADKIGKEVVIALIQGIAERKVSGA